MGWDKRIDPIGSDAFDSPHVNTGHVKAREGQRGVICGIDHARACRANRQGPPSIERTGTRAKAVVYREKVETAVKVTPPSVRSTQELKEIGKCVREAQGSCRPTPPDHDIISYTNVSI